MKRFGNIVSPKNNYKHMKILKIFTISVLLILGLFLFWYRFIYTEFDEFKNATFLEHRRGISTDGPYMLYSANSVRVVNVEKTDSDYEVTDKLLLKKDIDSIFTVNTFGYDNPTPVSFNVKLKSELKISPWEYTMPDKLFAVSDIEGNFYAFNKLLRANGIIDDNQNWTFGMGHLVLVGDFVDRGLNVTQCLWLAYKLEQQAEDAGGKVHFILGNHELLNMQGALANVRSKYKKLAKHLDLDYADDLYGKDSELGRWLRTKNSIIKIGDLLFTHAGISNKYLDMNISIAETNRIVRANIDTEPVDSVAIFLRGGESPLCTREMSHYNEADKTNLIDRAKRAYGVSTIIIGHSTVKDIKQEYNNSLIDIDVHFPHNDTDDYRGKGLLIESGVRYKVDDLGNKTVL